MIEGILLNESYLQFGISQPIDWLPDKSPHVMVCGSTGSGKTYFTKILLGKISLHEPAAQLYVNDFKGDDDFSFLSGCERFKRFLECSSGLHQLYERFKKRQSGEDISRNMLVLFFDEWGAYCNSLSDKKVIEEEKKKLSTLLMLGRSFRVHVIVSQQRADAIYFNSARDNFNLIVGLGNLSEESKNMLFHEYKDEIFPDRKQGTGYMLINGTNLTAIKVATIGDNAKLESFIKQGVTR